MKNKEILTGLLDVIPPGQLPFFVVGLGMLAFIGFVFILSAF